MTTLETARASRTDELLRLDGCDFAYGAVQVLFDVTFSVRRGEVLALLGTNGAGKSTVLRLVSGLSRPDRGSVRFGDADVTSSNPEARARRGISLISGGGAVFPDLTVEENLEIFGYAVRRDRDTTATRRARALELFPRLRERLHQPAGGLSGGEQQQLALTKALLVAPQLLCIDELSLGLAPIIVESLMDFVRVLAAEGTTIILVEQSLNVAAELCERALFMEKGEIRFEGATIELLERDDIARAVFFGEGRGQ
jgi:ABC-type branched-subunit amino acid transport system ATPase component